MSAVRRYTELPTVWTNVLAACVLAGGALDARVLLPLSVACSGFYVGVSAAWVGRLQPVAPDAEPGDAVVADARPGGRLAVPPSLVPLSRVLIYAISSLVVARTVPTPVLIGAMSLLAYLVGVSRADGTLSWPLVLLLVPLLPTLGLVRDPVGIVVWLGLLTFTVSRLGRRDALVAGIALVDATLIAHAGHPYLAAVATIVFVATLGLQRWSLTTA